MTNGIGKHEPSPPVREQNAAGQLTVSELKQRPGQHTEDREVRPEQEGAGPTGDDPKAR